MSKGYAGNVASVIELLRSKPRSRGVKLLLGPGMRDTGMRACAGRGFGPLRSRVDCLEEDPL